MINSFTLLVVVLRCMIICLIANMLQC